MADQQQISQVVAQVEWEDPPQALVSQVVAQVEWEDPPQAHVSQVVAQVEWEDPPQVRGSQLVTQVEWQEPSRVSGSQLVVQVEWVDLAHTPDTTINVGQGLAGRIKLTRSSTNWGLAGAIQTIPYVSPAAISLSGKALLTRSIAVPSLPGKALLSRSRSTLALPGEVLLTRASARMAVSGFVELMVGSSEVVLSDADRSLAGRILLSRISLSQGLAGAIKTGTMKYSWMPVSLNKWIDGAFSEVPLSSGADAAQLYMWGVLPDDVVGPEDPPPPPPPPPPSTVYALPEDRAYDWKGHVGVTGDIPNRATIYTTLSPSGGDDSGPIQTALNLCPAGQVVKLSPGTFLIKNNYIKVPAQKVLRGSGMGVTIIKGTADMLTKPFLLGFYNSPSYGTAVPAPNLSMGSKEVTTTRAHGLSVGDVIQIDQLMNPTADPPIQVTGYRNTATWIGRNGNRPLGMLNRVATVTSTTAFTTEIPLVWNFDSSGEVVKLNGTVSFAGIEDLSIDNQDSGSASQAGDWSTLVMHGAVDCWLRGVDLNGSFQTAIRIKYGYRNTLRSCKVHEGVPYNELHSYISGEGGRAYGLWIRPGSANLVENCRIYHCQIPITLNGESSANVFAYNFLTETYNGDDENWLHGAISPHGGHPVMNLFEGNYAFGRMCPDFVWGSSSHNVFFRQRVSIPATTPPESPWRPGGMPYEQALRCYDIQAKNQYYSVIGCVTGTVGKETEFEYNGITCPDTAKAIYRLGYAYDNPGLDQHDPQVAATLLRHGNWDSVHRTTVYNGSDCQVLPSSLYLDAQPSWWGSTAWPPIGPDVTPMYPADPGSGMPWDAVENAISPTTGATWDTLPNRWTAWTTWE